MFKTIFSKLIAIFISILLVGFSLTGLMLYYFLSGYVTEEKVGILDKSGDIINKYLGFYVENTDNPWAVQFLNENLELLSSNANAFIWVVNNDGEIIAYKPGTSQTEALLKKLADESGKRFKLNDVRQYNKVMVSGKTVQEIGDFYGFFKETGTSWLTLEKPFIYKEKILGAVYLHTPTPEVNRLRTSVLRFFMLSVTFSILISIIIAYLFSLRLSKPLKQINNAARIIAGGEFQKRLDIKSNDEIGELAASFNHMVVALQNLEEMRRGFIANVSHELRTPMTSIRGFIEGILDGTIPMEKQSYYLIIVRDEVNRLNRLVNDLLDLARMEAGEMSFHLRNFNLNELIRRCIIKLENIFIEKGLQVEADFETDEEYVNADPDAIERVIINLLHNAVKFTGENGIIKVSVSRHKEKVYVEVADNGIGIEKDEIDLIWERFHKSDKSRSRDKSGTGLGLAIIKNIINEHGQNIWVESELGKGSTFTFTLDREIGKEE